MSPVVLEDGVIHHPTRLSMGPAWLTAAIYLNVIGSKLAGGRAVRKGAVLSDIIPLRRKKMDYLVTKN